MPSELDDRFAARLVVKPPPTAGELAMLAAENWELVAEAAGIVVVERQHPGEVGHLVLSEKGETWLKAIRST